MVGRGTVLRRRPLLLAGVGAVVVALVVVLAVSGGRGRGERPAALRLATATPGGTYDKIGQGLAAVLSDPPEHPRTTVEALSTAGSAENLELLEQGGVELALVSAAILRSAPADAKGRVRLLARLYDGYIQVVARRDAGIERLGDLRGKRVYIGKERSGTEVVARSILDAADLVQGEHFTRVHPEKGLGAVADLLLDPAGGVDVAFLAGGIPTPAVDAVLESKTRIVPSPVCRLVDLGDVAARAAHALGAAERTELPERSYRHQDRAVSTVTAPVFLACRAELDTALVSALLDALFDNLHRLKISHPRAADIRLRSAFPTCPEPYHPGTLRFRAAEDEKLVIATGTLGGKYHRIGMQIQHLVERQGIAARAIHTEGSLDNARVLRARPALAIMQYDTALAVADSPRSVYWKSIEIEGEAGGFPHVDGLRSLAVLHEERTHIMVRQEVLPSPESDGYGATKDPTVADLAGLRVCYGPVHSGSQVLARAVLAHHDVPHTGLWMPVTDMISQLLQGHLDAGFFVSGEPSIAMRDLLAEPGMRLLSIDPAKLALLTGLTPALTVAEFHTDSYECLKHVKGPVRTVATRAVLVTREDLEDAETITRAIYQGAGYLPIEEDEREMAAPLASLDAHEDAETVYRERGLWPTPEDRSVEIIAAALSVIVILVGTYRGSRLLLHERVVDRMRGRILEVSVAATETDSVRKLMAIRDEVRERGRRRWWQPGRLSKGRWHDLEGTIADRITQARSTLSKSLWRRARALAGKTGEAAAQERASLRRDLWEHAEHGELDELQVIVALRALED